MLSALKNENSPFSEQQISALQLGLGQIDSAQTVWLSGYLAGRLAGDVTGSAQVLAPAAESALELRVFYGSQTGNGEQIAKALAANAGRAGISARLQSLNDLRPATLKKVGHAVFIISTHGEGDPPDDALDLFDFLDRPRAPNLETLKFRVLALGDSTYSQFCEAGRRLENLLLASGAKTFADRVDCDLDYESQASQWSAEVIEYQKAERQSEEIDTAGNSTGDNSASYLSVVPEISEWHRNRPFQATVEQVQKITGLESTKDIYHLELSLQGSDLSYQPGDSLGVWAFNASELVTAVLDRLGIAGGTEVEAEGQLQSITDVLTRHRELTRLSPDTVDSYARQTDGKALERHLEKLDSKQKQTFIEQRQFIDLVSEYPARMSAQELADLLRPLAPRSYSIASSQAAVDEEVHLTVASVYSDAIGEKRRGVASDFLNSRLQTGDEVGVFLEPNTRFHLPRDRSRPLILIAAGTGVAPYRAFLQQLEGEGASPESWLIFGNPHLRTDFLYQREWLGWRSSRLLSRIDGAFSRDQQEKRYVQHVIEDHAEEINDWLNRGAHIYVCGALAMGHAVDLALQNVVAHQRGLDDQAAASIIAGLRRERRLLKDLY